VITVDLQGHGRTADVDRPLRFQTMGDDIAALIRHLGLAQADVMGYSLGAGTALRTAIQHPALVRRLAIVSHPVRHDGWFPESLAGFDQMGPVFAEAMKQSPLYEVYSRVAPRVEDWPVLVDKMGTMLRQDYDWSAEVAKITAPVMLVYGDADSVRPAHIAEFYALLGGGLRDANWDGSARPHTLRHLLLARPDQCGYPVPGRGLARAARAHGAVRALSAGAGRLRASCPTGARRNRRRGRPPPGRPRPGGPGRPGPHRRP